MTAPNSDRGKFASYVTSTAFSLSLSRGMIEELAGAVQGQHVWFNRSSGLYGLERRGLVTVEAIVVTTGNVTQPCGYRWTVTPTRAGKITFLLCVEAGLISDTGNGDISSAVAAIELELANFIPEQPKEPA